jgi:ubiquinone/menaquinone biosynthesis C-methylase UbiE
MRDYMGYDMAKILADNMSGGDMPNEWKEFFNSHASVYDQEIFTKNTTSEVEFLIKEFNLPVGASILDIGCGTGRHSIGLALHGCKMTGVDISPEMLNIARELARQQQVDIELICSDAQSFITEKMFDGAICLCEGAFGLLGSADDPFEHDVKILNNIYRTLKNGAKFILTCLSSLRNIRMYSDADVAQGKFDVLTMVDTTEMEIETGEGKKKITVRERVYTPPELRRILQIAGFQVEHIFGGTAGSWNKQTPKLDEYELMAICRKQVATA